MRYEKSSDSAHSPATARAAVVHGYTAAFSVGALLLLLAAVATGTLIRASRHDVHEAMPSDPDPDSEHDPDSEPVLAATPA